MSSVYYQEGMSYYLLKVQAGMIRDWVIPTLVEDPGITFSMIWL